MAYIPTTQLNNGSAGGYVPTTKLKEENSFSAPIDFGTPSFGGMAQSTPAMLSPDYKSPVISVGEFGKEVGQSIARNVASFGATAFKPIVEKTGTAIAGVESPTVEAFTGALSRSLFGDTASNDPVEITGETRAEQLRPMDQRIASYNEKVLSKGKELEQLSYAEGLSTQERLLTSEVGKFLQKNSNSISFTVIGGLVGMDLTPFGGLEKNVFKSMIKATTVGDALVTLKKMGVADDLARNFAEEVVKVTTEKEAKNLFNAIVKIQGSTKAGATSKYVSTVEKFGQVADDARAVGNLPVETVPPLSKLDSTVPAKVVETPRQRVITQAADTTYKQLDELASRIKSGGVSDIEYDNIRTEIAIIEDTIENTPGKQFAKYESRATGRLPEVTGTPTIKSLTGSGRTVSNSEFGVRGDQIVQEILGMGDSYGKAPTIEDAQFALDSYKKSRERLIELKSQATEIRKEKSAIRKGEYLMQLAKGDRRAAYRSLGETFALTDNELTSLRGGKDIMAMTKPEFDDFMRVSEGRAAQIAERSEMRLQLEGTIYNKELRNFENVREAMKLPKIADMTINEMKKLEKVLSQYKDGDVFLTTRQLETIDRTDLSGLRTEREVLEHLAKTRGLTVADVSGFLKPHPWMYDTQLARQHPFYSLLVEKYNASFLKAAEKTIGLVSENDKLLIAARNSKPKSVIQRLVPTDDLIVQYREAGPELRATLAKEMTPEELKVAEFQEKYYQEVYNWMTNRDIEKKFTSRFEDTYYPHIRRGFLEAWKEDGFTKGLAELTKDVEQKEALMTILNDKTGDVLPYQKWVGAQQFRTGELVPTKNAALAFKSYVSAVEKARQYDEFIPEMMTYVHTLTPKGMTDRGIELNDTVQQFFKEWINSKKGRVKKQIITPGSKGDWALRTGVAILRIRDLGFNLTSQIVSGVGEQVGNITMLRTRYPLGIARLPTKQGQAIIKKYENFVGQSIYDRLVDPAGDVGDKLMTGLMGIFGEASRQSNATFLLSMMTPEEFASGTISLERLAFLRNKVGKYRVVDGAESVAGKSVEAAVVKQHKKWAIPVIVSTADNLKVIARNITKDPVKALQSEEGLELLTSTLLAGAISLGTAGYYSELKEKKDRNVVEEFLYKATRESLSLIGALDPRFLVGYAKPRLVQLLTDLSDALVSIAKMEEYVIGEKKGNLKGVEKLKKTVTPVMINTLLKDSDTVKKSSSGSDALKKYKTSQVNPLSKYK